MGWTRRRTVLSLVGLGALAALVAAPAPAGRPAHAQAPAGALRYHVVAEASEARYRVREQLVGLSFPNDAVGQTRAIEGALVLDAAGRLLPGESRITIDLRTLRSDEARRDNYLRRNTLETDRFPAAVLAARELRGLPGPLPRTGTATLELVGDLTVRDATRRTVWAATAAFQGDDVRVQARTSLRFEELSLRIPRVSIVLSVEDRIQLEADLLLRRAARS